MKLLKGPVTGGGGGGYHAEAIGSQQHNNTTFPHQKRSRGHKIPAVMMSAEWEDELWRVIEAVAVAKTGGCCGKVRQ
jgi:hypothetical protein